MYEIKKVAVLGAGTMGSGIAAHLANAGVDVILLDVDAAIAERAVDRQVKAGGFMDPVLAKRVKTGSTADLEPLTEVDWIVEAVAERVDIKHELLQRLEQVRSSNTIVSSNTSTIPLKALQSGLSEDFASHFLIAHFFNPPRRMRLMELVSGPKTLTAVVTAVRDFADLRLGKVGVFANDTPGFIANRIGAFWLGAAEHEAIRLGLDVEVADALIGKPFGIPSTGVFGLLDLIGIDIMLAIQDFLQHQIRPNDPLLEYAWASAPSLKLIRNGGTGRKAGAGFYRQATNKQARESIDLRTGEYKPVKPLDEATLRSVSEEPGALMANPDVRGRYASTVMLKTLAYAARLIPEIADTPDAVDNAMRYGYGWEYGPFELIDRLGPAWFIGELNSRELNVPPLLAEAATHGSIYTQKFGENFCLRPGGQTKRISPPSGVLSLSDLRRRGTAVDGDEYGSLWDMGDGVALFDFHTKMNVIKTALLQTLARFVKRAENDFRAVVIGNESSGFGAGADLSEFLAIIAHKSQMTDLLERGQSLFRSIKFSRIPIVAGARGWALGGSCELALHCSAIQANAELTMGLVETRVGLVPGWGGCKELLLRLDRVNDGAPRDPISTAEDAFALLSNARVSTSALNARSLGYLVPGDAISMNPDRLLADAKMLALQLSADYRPPKPATIALSGPAGASVLRSRLDELRDGQLISVHDYTVSRFLIEVITGGPSADPSRPVPEEAICSLERAAFLELISMADTIARIRHTLTTGKPLRN